MNNQKYCPLCLSSSFDKSFLASSKTYSHTTLIEATINICSNCNSYFIKNYVDEDKIGVYYPKTYYTRNSIIHPDPLSLKYRIRLISYHLFKSYPLKTKLTPLLLFASIVYGIFFWHRWGRFPKYIETQNKRRALEVGYGAGNYLFDLNNLGWDCMGYDIDQSSAEDLKTLGISVAPNYKSLNLEDNSIDYIYSYHAFEHIYNIDEAMAHCSSILAKDGIFKLCVPVSDGLVPRLFKEFWYDLGVPIHKQIFTISGLEFLAERHGFEVKNFKYNSYSQSLVGSLFAFYLQFKNGGDQAAQDFSNTKIFKILCLLLSPLVFCLDLIKLGDRIEAVLTKKSET